MSTIPLIHINNAILRNPELRFETPLNFDLHPHEHWAIVGPNGAGKTTFANTLTNKLPLAEGSISYQIPGNDPLYEKIKTVSFRNMYSLADSRHLYYQQRWQSAEEKTPLVRDLIEKSGEKEEVERMVALFGVEDLLDKNIICLSSGELRKYLLVNALKSIPKVLILDNPYVGLDEKSRTLLNDLLTQLAQKGGTQLMLILSNPDEIPDVITHVLPFRRMCCLPGMSRADFFADEKLRETLFVHPQAYILPPVQAATEPIYSTALDMRNIHIRYGEYAILESLSWQVKRGEKWALLGPNGAGKSTLLSLICGDNPQAYANDFSLFGKKRGSGESIWDIKKRIGYASPEMLLYYRDDIACINVVCSGFFDHVGLHRKCTQQQRQAAWQWMEVFGIARLREKSFLKISFGEQHMVMLARAFVKNPELLILDEPMHGLDPSNKARVTQIIEMFCEQRSKTLIYVTHYFNEVPKCITKRKNLAAARRSSRSSGFLP
ncbi:MAG: ATP-binding cassette domain-containing protein [Prevotellaceae bacterium]|jgi:molybdate transport system ATP-binding protein|nr:ATP-binding cassette domain-containing protein [Prevotellaceae bacterium]